MNLGKLIDLLNTLEEVKSSTPLWFLQDGEFAVSCEVYIDDDGHVVIEVNP